jgi:hypothetical protein
MDPSPEHGTTYIDESLQRLAGRQTTGSLEELPFTHTKHQQVGRSIGKYPVPYTVRPVVVMGKPAEACLDPPDHNRYAREERMYPVRIHDRRPIRSFE